MKFTHIVFAGLLLLFSALVVASDWASRVKEIVPDNITLITVEEIDGAVRITGQANSNTDISALMRAVENSDLGSSDLKQIKRSNGISSFVLLVEAKR